MTPDMQKKRVELAADYSREDLTVKEDFISGFNAAHDLMQEKIKPLIKSAMWFAHNPPTHFDDCQSLYEDDDEKCNCGAESRHNDLVAALKGWE